MSAGTPRVARRVEASGRGRTIAWRLFTGHPTDVVRRPETLDAARTSIVAGLHTAADRYPTDPELRSLVDDLHARSGAFVRLWDDPFDRPDGSERLDVPDGRDGRAAFDTDVVTLQPGDLRVVVFTRSA